MRSDAAAAARSLAGIRTSRERTDAMRSDSEPEESDSVT